MGWEKKTRENGKTAMLAGLTGWYLNQRILDHVAVIIIIIFYHFWLFAFSGLSVCTCGRVESILKSLPRFLWHALWVPPSPFSTSLSGEHGGLGRFRRVCTTQSLAKRFFLVTGLQNDFPFELLASKVFSLYILVIWVCHILFLLLSQTAVVDVDNTWLVYAY